MKIMMQIWRWMWRRLAVQEKGGMSWIQGETVKPGSLDIIHPRMVWSGCKVGRSKVQWREKLGLLWDWQKRRSVPGLTWHFSIWMITNEPPSYIFPSENNRRSLKNFVLKRTNWQFSGGDVIDTTTTTVTTTITTTTTTTTSTATITVTTTRSTTNGKGRPRIRKTIVLL